MVFVIKDKKYDTEKMSEIGEVKKWYSMNSQILNSIFGFKNAGRDYTCKLWRSSKGNWLLTSERDYGHFVAEAIEETEAKNLLKIYCLDKYEELFGELEEA